MYGIVHVVYLGKQNKKQFTMNLTKPCDYINKNAI